ncbi:unnamed protein product, partial [Symbiodinium microadriaticum]
TMYRVYAVAHHNQSADNIPIRMNDRAIELTQQRFRTVDSPPEILDLEWNRLDSESRFDELLAAIYDTSVQKAAKAAGIELPTADMLEEWLDAQDRSDSEKEKSESGSDEGEDNDGGEEKDSREVVGKFMDWWIDGDDMFGYSPARNAFLLAEALYICRDGETIELCEDDGYLTFAQTEVLNALVKGDDR